MSPATTTDELTVRAAHAWRVLLTHEPGDVTAAAIALDYVQEACDDRAACLAAIRKVAAEEWWMPVREAFEWADDDRDETHGFVQNVRRLILGPPFVSNLTKEQVGDWVGIGDIWEKLAKTGLRNLTYIDALVSAL